MPLRFQPGETFQFDWDKNWAVIVGHRVKLQVAHTRLSFSRAFILRAYPLQTHEMLFDALTCLIQFEGNRYSVPASFANRPVSLRVYPDRLRVIAEGQVLCMHDRIITRSHGMPGRTVYDWRHYLAIIQRKPGALCNGSPFTELPWSRQRPHCRLP